MSPSTALPAETVSSSEDAAANGSGGLRIKSFERPSRRTLAWGCAAVVTVVALAAGIPWYLHAMSHESTDDAFIEGHIVPISPRVSGNVAKVYVDDNQWVDQGDLLLVLDASDYEVRLAAAEEALKAAEATQQANTINVDLTKITSSADIQEATAAVEAAKGAVETAEALVAATASQADQARAQLLVAQAGLKGAEAEVESAEAKHRRDSADLQRYQGMVVSKAVSEQDLDHAATAERITASESVAAKGKVEACKAAIAEAQAAVQAADNSLQQVRAQVTSRKAELGQANARLATARAAPQQVAYSQAQAAVSSAKVAQARADVDQARLNLAYTKIRAPCSGHVTRKTVEAGAYVQTGQSLLALVEPDVWIVANFKETQLGRMQPQQPVAINVDMYSGVVFKGHVDSVQRGTGARFSLLPPQNATGNYIKVVQRMPVKILFDDPAQLRKYLLAPGMSVAPEVDVAAAPRHTPPAPVATTSTSSPASSRQLP